MKHLIFFAGMTMLAVSAFASPHAYPVPYVQKHDTGNQYIHFIELPTSGTIKVVTMAGEEVVKLEIPPGMGIRQWNLRNSSDKPVPSDVYLYTVDGEGQKTTGKLVIVR